MTTISPAALALIKSFEGDPPPRHPEWPGGDSGITLGYGSDIGADPAAMTRWKPFITDADFRRLDAVKGLTGDAAALAQPSVADIVISQEASDAVFAAEMEVYAETTLSTFPGSEALPADSFGALVSLVFNRGGSLQGPRRSEMLAIHDVLLSGPDHWVAIINLLAAMVRLWNNGVPTTSNLPGRRLCEAALFAQGLDSIGLLPPGALYVGRSGAAVQNVQSIVKATPDGKFGRGTMLAVWSYQHRINEPQTGVWMP